jgi:hypothetical protein
VGNSIRRQNNGIAPNQAQGDPADESTGQPLPNLQRPYWSRSGHCGFQPTPYLCHMNDCHLKVRLPAQRRHQLDEITRKPTCHRTDLALSRLGGCLNAVNNLARLTKSAGPAPACLAKFLITESDLSAAGRM